MMMICSNKKIISYLNALFFQFSALPVKATSLYKNLNNKMSLQKYVKNAYS